MRSAAVNHGLLSLPLPPPSCLSPPPPRLSLASRLSPVLQLQHPAPIDDGAQSGRSQQGEESRGFPGRLPLQGVRTYEELRDSGLHSPTRRGQPEADGIC